MGTTDPEHSVVLQSVGGRGLDPDPGLSAGATLQAPGHPSPPRPLAPGCPSFCAATLWRHPRSCSPWSVVLGQATEWGFLGHGPRHRPRSGAGFLAAARWEPGGLPKEAASCGLLLPVPVITGAAGGAATSAPCPRRPAEQTGLPAPRRRAAESSQSTFPSVTSSWLPRSPRLADGTCPYWVGAGPTRDAGREAQGTHCTRGLGVETGALPQSPTRMFGVQADLGGGVRAACSQAGPQRPQGRERRAGPGAQGLGQGGPQP